MFLDLDNDSSIGSETNSCEVPVLDGIPTDLELAVAVSSETDCIEENLIIDTFEYVEFADGLPDHSINISGLIKGIGSRPKPFCGYCQSQYENRRLRTTFCNCVGT